MEFNIEEIGAYLIESMENNNNRALTKEKMESQISAIISMIFEASILKDESGEKEKVINVCDEILKLHPGNIYAILLKAGALNELHKYDQALILLKLAAESHPNNAEVYYLLAMNHFCMGDYEKALQLIDRSINLDKRFDSILSKAQMLKLLGKKGHNKFVEEARKIDEERCDNFMRDIWLEDMKEFKGYIDDQVDNETRRWWNKLVK